MAYEYDYEERAARRNSVAREIVIWAVEIGLVVLLAYIIVAFGLVKTTMIGDSMSTTLEDGNSIIVNKMIYRFTSPKRNDVVVFKQSGSEHSFYNIKRIIGLPGETVQIVDGLVMINGEKLDEYCEFEAMNNSGLAKEEYTLDANEYFVLGDNRNQSEDSRFANIGAVIKGDIVGKAWMRLKPFGFVSNINKKVKLNTESEGE